MVCSMQFLELRRFHALRGIGVCEDKKTDTQNLSVGLSVTML